MAVAKLGLVAPRPHLLAVCGFEAPMQVCGVAGNLTWAPEQVCEANADALHEALRAFPSYHAALAAYWYVRERRVSPVALLMLILFIFF